MIFITVGTWHLGFDRLIKSIDGLINNKIIQEDVVIQIGNGEYYPSTLNVVRFCTPAEFDGYIQQARVIITHAGVGSMMTGILNKKPVIVLPRKSSFNEVSDDHQFDTASQFEKEGLVLVAYGEDDIESKLQEAKNFIPDQKSSGLVLIQKEIHHFIKNVEVSKDKRPLPEIFWPYYILERGDDELKSDLKLIIEQFHGEFDIVVFIPNAGTYLHQLFVEVFSNKYITQFITVRRKVSTSKNHIFKDLVFKHRNLSNFMRHVEVFLRLIKGVIKLKRNRVVSFDGLDVHDKRVLVIDDSVDSGSTMKIVKKAIKDSGAESVMFSCISNHLTPKSVFVDFSVYEYALLRTKNSKDYESR
ncbi:MAG: UDP-N-acetylglucosamine transferase subunit ALG13 [Colwellia sp.]